MRPHFPITQESYRISLRIHHKGAGRPGFPVRTVTASARPSRFEGMQNDRLSCGGSLREPSGQ
jgi:hypothetical protein